MLSGSSQGYGKTIFSKSFPFFRRTAIYVHLSTNAPSHQPWQQRIRFRLYLSSACIVGPSIYKPVLEQGLEIFIRWKKMTLHETLAGLTVASSKAGRELKTIGMASQRRTIQNRRNKRTHRSRRQRQRTANDTAHLHNLDMRAIADACKVLDAGLAQSQVILQHFEAVAHSLYKARVPNLTILPTVSRFNIVWAFLENINVFGFSSSQIRSDNAMSPFNSLCP